MRINAYIDGFNLYYGALKDTDYKWLDLAALCYRKCPTGDTINHIRYFTAPVGALPNNPDQPIRQRIYLRALSTIPNLSIMHGTFLSNPKMMPRTDGRGLIEVHKTEEKGTDVNIATMMLVDALDNNCDKLFLFSNDSDLALPIQVIRQKFSKEVVVFYPKLRNEQRASKELARVSTSIQAVRAADLRACQFPRSFPDRNGTITKPSEW